MTRHKIITNASTTTLTTIRRNKMMGDNSIDTTKSKININNHSNEITMNNDDDERRKRISNIHQQPEQQIESSSPTSKNFDSISNDSLNFVKKSEPPDENDRISNSYSFNNTNNNKHNINENNRQHQTINSHDHQKNNNSHNNLTSKLSSIFTWFSWTIATNIHSMFRSSTIILSRARQYLRSLRPSTFFTSLIPVLMGTVLAHKTTGGHQFSWVILLATLVTVLSIHAAGNLVNTYCDFMRGIDSKRQSDDRTLVDSILSPEEVVNLGVLFYFIGCIGFLVVVLQSPARMELLAFIYFGGLSSSFLYTGGIGLKYIALGDIIIMITFGPVSVLYSFIAQTGTIRLVTLLYAIPLALNAEAILHSNNTRDIEVDRRAGCVTIAILIGYRASHVLFALLLFVPYILFVVVSFNYSLWLLLPLITLPKAFHLEKQFRYKQLRHIPRQMAKLNFYFGMFYLFACFMSPAHKLPGLLR